MNGVEYWEQCFNKSQVDYYTERAFYRERSIYINLGMKCNLNCIYCMNKDNRGKVFPSQMTAKFKEFISHKLPKALGKEKRLLQFWGGEPLLFFNEIKEVVKLIKDIPNYVKIIVTNGTLLTDEIVEYLNEHEIRVGLSNDGPSSKLTRGVDILENDEIVRLIHNIKYFTQTVSVINEYCSNFYARERYFNAILQPSHAKFILEFPYDTDGSFKVNPDLQHNLEMLFKNIKKQLIDGVTNYSEIKEFLWLDKYIRRYIYYYQNKDKPFDTRLIPLNNKTLFDTKLISLHTNMDLEGNLYLEPDGRWQIGDVNMSLSEFTEIAIRLLEKKTPMLSKCSSCEIFPLCKGSPILPLKNSEKFCEINKLWCQPIIDFMGGKICN